MPSKLKVIDKGQLLYAVDHCTRGMRSLKPVSPFHPRLILKNPQIPGPVFCVLCGPFHVYLLSVSHLFNFQSKDLESSLAGT